MGWHILAGTVFFLLFVPILWLFSLRGRQATHEPMSIVFGSSPIINSKYHVAAMRLMGWHAASVVRGFYARINRPDDYDEVFGPQVRETFRGKLWAALFEPYVVFARVIRNYEVFAYYFNGFYLPPPYKWLEVPVLRRVFGRLVVAMPYGADVTTITGALDVERRHVTYSQYPSTALVERSVRRRVNHFTRWADLIIGGLSIGPDHLPRIDLLLSSFFAIDEGEWQPEFGKREDGQPLRVLHAPNHRKIKGTDFLIEAVDALRSEGMQVELVLLEGVPNTRVRDEMARCHVVAEQFFMGWYGLTALEGMASGKAVLTYLRPDLHNLYRHFSFAENLPIVNTPVDEIAKNLRLLYDNPALCADLGRQGRAYVEEHHALRPMGQRLANAFREAWRERTSID